MTICTIAIFDKYLLQSSRNNKFNRFKVRRMLIYKIKVLADGDCVHSSP